jgi:hypothetical protein
MFKCKACGAEIEFVKLISGKLNPVNKQYKIIITDTGEVLRGRESHFATCPGAKHFRGSKKK